jgi:phospholipase C
MLVIFYDEHGGFYDHVPPPAAADDNQRIFGRYGVRVPALIVSPWTEPGSVSTTVFDHTSIIKTILLRFAPDALNQPKRHRGLLTRAASAGCPRYLGTRVAQAHDLGELLTSTAPRPAPDRFALIQDAAARAAARPQGAKIHGDALGLPPATDLQIGLAAAARELRRRGHPENRHIEPSV